MSEPTLPPSPGVTTRRYGMTAQGRPIEEVTFWAPVDVNHPNAEVLVDRPGYWAVAGISQPLGAYAATEVPKPQWQRAEDEIKIRRATEAEEEVRQMKARAKADADLLEAAGIEESVRERLTGHRKSPGGGPSGTPAVR